MKVKILTSGALIDPETDERAGLYEDVDVPKERAEYLISVGAAVALSDKDREDTAELEEHGRPVPVTGGATTTQENDPATGARRQPVQRKAPAKTDKK